MKSIFHHEIGPKLHRYAMLKGIDRYLLIEKYHQGLIPLEFIQSMFAHISLAEVWNIFMEAFEKTHLYFCLNLNFDDIVRLFGAFR